MKASEELGELFDRLHEALVELESIADGLANLEERTEIHYYQNVQNDMDEAENEDNRPDKPTH